jgi:hypothetical protein
LKLSALPSARPPDTTRDAGCRSGRPVAAAERETKRVCVGSSAFAFADSTLPLPPDPAGWNDAVRTVATSFLSGYASTVSTALPA